MYEYPHTLAAGQKQCIGIARSIALNPSFIVADEPISALDVSVRAMVLNLLKDLQASKNLTYMFISHDIRVVRWLSSHIAVMYLGKLVEYAETEELFHHRLHPYTEALLIAVPIEDPETATSSVRFCWAKYLLLSLRRRAAVLHPAVSMRRNAASKKIRYWKSVSRATL